MKDMTETFARISSVMDLEKSLRDSHIASVNRVVNLELKMSTTESRIAYMEPQLSTVCERVSALEKWRSNMEGRIATYAAVIVFVIAVTGLIIKFVV